MGTERPSCRWDTHLGLSTCRERFISAARQSLLHGLHHVLHAAPVAHPHLVVLPLAGGPDLFKVGNDVVAPRPQEMFQMGSLG